MTEHLRGRKKLTYLVEPRLERGDALALLRDVQEVGVERDDVSRTSVWNTVTLDDGTVVELSDRWVREDSVFSPSVRLASEQGQRVPPPPPDVLEARARAAEEAASNVTQIRRSASSG